MGGVDGRTSRDHSLATGDRLAHVRACNKPSQCLKQLPPPHACTHLLGCHLPAVQQQRHEDGRQGAPKRVAGEGDAEGRGGGGGGGGAAGAAPAAALAAEVGADEREQVVVQSEGGLQGRSHAAAGAVGRLGMRCAQPPPTPSTPHAPHTHPCTLRAACVRPPPSKTQPASMAFMNALHAPCPMPPRKKKMK